MLEDDYRALAKELSCKFSVSHDNQRIMGASYPSSTYLFQLDYRGITINARVDMGNINVGTLDCEIDKQPSINRFSITRLAPFKQLFKKKKGFLFATGNYGFKTKIEQSQHYNELFQIANSSMFDLQITGSNVKDKFLISSEYPMLVENKAHVLFLLFSLFKEFVDFYNE